MFPSSTKWCKTFFVFAKKMKGSRYVEFTFDKLSNLFHLFVHHFLFTKKHLILKENFKMQHYSTISISNLPNFLDIFLRFEIS